MEDDVILQTMSEAPIHEAASASPEARHQALLEVAEAIAQHRDLGELFHELAERLHRVVEFDYLNLILYDPLRNVMRLHILESEKQFRKYGPGSEFAIGETPSGWVWESQRPYLLDDIEKETRIPEIVQTLRENGVRSFCSLALTTAQRRLGVMSFGRGTPHTHTESEVAFLQQVARQVAVAVDNALNFESAQAYQRQLARERDRLRVLLEVNNAVVSKLDLHVLLNAIAASLRRVIHHEYTSLAVFEPEANSMRVLALNFPEGKGLIREDLLVPVERALAGKAFRTHHAQVLDRNEIEAFDSVTSRLMMAEGVRSLVCMPLITHDRALGTLSLASLRDSAFQQGDVDLLAQVASQVAIAVENALAFQEIAELKNKLAQEKLYLEDEIRSEMNFDEIIGESAPVRAVLKQVETVAPTDSTVLITGETGTGKELIARAIHNLSPRRERTFVKVNCAAIPTGLLESELFGHERGAFTGAIAQRIGRFELADGGTIFLDEIGDIPLELQPKLLRVLQEQEFERLGSTHTTRVDIRLVAATNRNLAEMVAARTFRSDLYYRLRVFPILMPPLRDRQGDIPSLVRYFVEKHARRMNRKVETIPAETLEQLVHYPWPGNIRELENLIERAVIVSPGPVLRVPLGELRSGGETLGETQTLRSAERDHILKALEATKWVLAGPRGAAVRLGMKRTTLQSKMRKLGIEKHK
ncbi:MAG TPA: sigma 54-interacting transcriptional regulator [Candidatus Saccharimonadales bacterium]|jgi:formate hydrogenlyase transcriptional activator|nr:sigma 54-interacting transcriptional regulator [Candidatus Saccharimonadales bacterium]